MLRRLHTFSDRRHLKSYDVVSNIYVYYNIQEVMHCFVCYHKESLILRIILKVQDVCLESCT